MIPNRRKHSGRAALGPILVLVLLAGCARYGDDRAAPAAPGAADERPNIVLILADDLGYGDPGSYNPASKIPTPHMDRLAAEGMRFTDAHSPSAVCTPTRYAVLTGRYSWRSALKRGVLRGYSPNLIDTTRVTIPALLKQAGYATAGVGKWHLGLGEADSTDYHRPLRPGPVSLGFDYYYGIPASLDMAPYLYFENDRMVGELTARTEDSMPCCTGAFWRGGPMTEGFRHEDVTPDLTDKAVAYIEEQTTRSRGQPFFLYVPFPSPHTPWLPTEAFRGVSGAGEYGDFTAQVDASIGRILEALDRTGVAESTLVVVTSDNGPYWRPEEIERFGHRAQGGWRGMKADVWEGGHRVPFVVRWPGRVEAGTTSDQTITHTDLLATFAGVTGLAVPAGAGEDSYDLTPLFLGTHGSEPLREATVHHSSRGLFAIRQGPWKLIEGLGSGGFSTPDIEPGPGDPAGQLYNLEEDPGETVNLYAERPEVVRRLQDLLDRYRSEGRSLPQ